MKKLILLITILFSKILFSQEVDIINTGENVGLENWRIVNDYFMGGISKSNLYLNSNGNLIFEGEVSLENNGGFASCRLGTENGEMNGIKSFKIKLKGDGKIYKFRVSERNGSINYSTNFQTKKGVWEEINIPIKELEPTFMGYYSSRAPRLKIENMRTIGFLISDKQKGYFNLEVMHVKGVF
jgi:monofunctional biosynthetic peptidoglycan transglycosylase